MYVTLLFITRPRIVRVAPLQAYMYNEPVDIDIRGGTRTH